jgi:hypothetical protein
MQLGVSFSLRRLATEAPSTMPENLRATDLLPRKFTPTNFDRRRWRRIVGWSRSDRTLKLLKQIEAERTREVESADPSVANRTWLLRYRADLHWAIWYSRLEPIKLYLADCPPEMVPLAVWLWGKCADRFRLYGFSAFCNDPSAQVRKHVAKALRRLEAWTLLAEMAAANPDDARIQWFANTPTTHRSFPERLKNFARNVDNSHAGEVVTPSPMPFWRRERDWEGRSPKSAWYIRLMLWRIRRWVRGDVQ